MRRREFVERALEAAGLTAIVTAAPALPIGAVRPLAGQEHGFGSPATKRPRPFSAPRLDAHAHVASPRVAEWINGLAGEGSIESLDADQLVARMDAEGVEQALVLSTAYMYATDAFPTGLSRAEERVAVESENDFNAQQCARHPDRLLPFCSVNPKREWASAEIDRCAAQLGTRGVKFHFWNSVVDIRSQERLTDLRGLFGQIADRGLPAVVHVYNGAMEDFGADDVERFVHEVVEPNRELRLSFAHVGGAGGSGTGVRAIFQRLSEIAPAGSPLGSRLWVDIAAVMFMETFKSIVPTAQPVRAEMAELIRAWGPERTLWGSDMVPGYVAQTEGVWPLSEDEWDTVASQTTQAFLAATAGTG